MLRRPERLARSRDVEAVLRRGKATRNKLFVVRRVVQPGRTISRATVVVSKRVSKKAVERNRLKRQVRALLPRLLRKRKPAMDVTVSIQAAARGKSATELDRALQELLS